MKSFLKMFSMNSNVSFAGDFRNESEVVKQKRAEAIKKMKEIGRSSLIEGGKFSLNNNILNTGFTESDHSGKRNRTTAG